MKNRETKTINLIKDQTGYLVVEASIVYPVMFFVLFFLIFYGNVFYQKSQIDDLVTKCAIRGAQYCADPILVQMEENGGVVPDKVDVKPYRYILGGMSEVENMISDRVKSGMASESSFFTGMQPVIKNGNSKIASFNNYVLYSTFSVEVEYQITFPIRFLGKKTPTIITNSSRADIPVVDSAEFIRNTDMAVDFLEDTIVGQKVASVFSKVNSFISNFAKK